MMYEEDIAKVNEWFDSRPSGCGLYETVEDALDAMKVRRQE